MWTRAILFVLGWAVCGTYGCALVVSPSARNFRAPQQLESPKSSATVSSEPATEMPLEGRIFALIEEQQQASSPAVSAPITELALTTSEKKTEAPEVREK